MDGALRVAKVGDRRHYGQNYHLRGVDVLTDQSHNDVVDVLLRVIDPGDARKVDQCEGA